MSIFTWSDEFSVEVPSIDEQHIQLVKTLNRLHDGLSDGESRDDVSKLLRSFISFTAFHFSYEESLFKAHAYPSADAHAEEHRRLVTRLMALRRRFDAREEEVDADLTQFLKEWLVLHILGTDRAYSGHLVERGVL